MDIKKFRAALESACRAQNVDISGLVIQECTMDRTWGDLCGLFFAGEHAERAANWFRGWLGRNPPKRTYQAQYSIGDVQAWHLVKDRKNPALYSSGKGHEMRVESYITNPEEYRAQFDVTAGYAVAYVYYPCNE